MTLNEVFGALIIILTVAAYIVDFATKGKYRSRKLALVLFVIGLVIGAIGVYLSWT